MPASFTFLNDLFDETPGTSNPSVGYLLDQGQPSSLQARAARQPPHPTLENNPQMLPRYGQSQPPSMRQQPQASKITKEQQLQQAFKRIQQLQQQLRAAHSQMQSLSKEGHARTKSCNMFLGLFFVLFVIVGILLYSISKKCM